MFYRRLIILASSFILLIIGSGFFLSWYVETKLKESIRALHGNFTSLNINLFTETITVNHLEWNSKMDMMNVNPHLLKMRSVTADGIDLYELFRHKILFIESITIDSGTVQYNTAVKRVKKKAENSAYRHFRFKKIVLHKIITTVKTDTITGFTGILNGSVNELDIQVDSLNTLDYAVESVVASLQQISVSRTAGMYGGTIAGIHVNTLEKTLTVDSATLIPNHGKFDFARLKGEQIARVEITIPHLMVTGLQYDRLIDSTVIASKVTINSFALASFKDRRVPFLRKFNVPLPMVNFLGLPCWVKLDSIIIHDSQIRIEEFPEQGKESGVITFNKINGSIINLNNRINEVDPTSAQMNLTALLLNTGSIEGQFLFPLDGTPVYTTIGSLSNMNLTELNPFLSALAHIRIETGYLNKMSFQFKYTDLISRGTLNLDYKELKLMSLDRHNRQTDGLKTFLMNTLIRHSRSQSSPANRQTALIGIDRDRKRYVPNLWLKSILDGLKSSTVGKTVEKTKK
jgi:Domain of Unknown Function (DUF748).